MESRLALFFISLMLLTLGCSSDSTDDLFIDCAYSAPEKIFSEDLPSVSLHHFQMGNMQAEETLQFENGSKLKLIQSGCDYLKQAFEFSSPMLERQKSATYWVEESLNLLKMISQLGPEFITYNSWASAIHQKTAEFELDKFLELQEGYYVKINHRNQKGDAILMLTLSEKPLD
ncbi:MAG: hypothetical protein R2828_31380 [Saprospiraceae bacterium]